MNTKAIFAAFFLFFMCDFSRADSEKLTLEEALSLGLKSNISILKEEQNLAIARQQVREARLLFLPSLVLSADYARSNLDYPLILNNETGPRYIDPYYKDRDFYGFRASAILPIYTGGRYRKTLELSKINYSRQKVNLDISTRDTEIKIKKAFYLALRSKYILADIKKYYSVAEKYFSKIPSNSYEYPDALKIMYEMNKERMDAEKNYHNHISEIKTLIYKSGTFEPEGDFSPLCQMACEEKKVSLAAIENSAELLKNIYQSKIDAVSVEMAFRRKYPNVYLGFSKDVTAQSISSLTNSDENFSASAAFINITLPINYDFWTEIQKKKAEERANELEMLSIREELRNKSETACREYNYYCERIRDDKRIIDEIESLIGSNSKNDFLALKQLKLFCEFKKAYYNDVYSQIEKAFELEKFLKK